MLNISRVACVAVLALAASPAATQGQFVQSPPLAQVVTTPVGAVAPGAVQVPIITWGRDPRTRPVVIYQLTWSSGGDALVVKSGVRFAKELKGKTVAVQAYGPHVDYLSKI